MTGVDLAFVVRKDFTLLAAQESLTPFRPCGLCCVDGDSTPQRSDAHNLGIHTGMLLDRKVAMSVLDLLIYLFSHGILATFAWIHRVDLVGLTFFTRVTVHVSLQGGRAGESFIADFTLVLLLSV